MTIQIFNRRILLAALALTALLASPARAGQIETAEKQVTQLIEDVRLVTAKDGLDMAGKQQEVQRLLDRYFDVPGIARAAAGQYWRAASETERQRYQELFVAVMVTTAAGQFDQFRGLDFRLTASQARGDKMVLVGGVISDPSGQRADVIVNWRLTTLPGEQPRIIDIEIENISMLMTQRQEHTAIIRKNGGQFSALLEQLKNSAR